MHRSVVESQRRSTEQFLLWSEEAKKNFDKYYDLLMAMAGSVVYVGELGSGNVAKLANQVIVALNIAAVSEALTLAVKKMMQIRSLYTKLSAEVLQDLQCLMQKHQ